MSNDWRVVVAGVLAFVLVVALVPLCRRFALAKGICDAPEPGKVHRDPTPYLGGVSIAVSAVLCSLLLPGWKSEAEDAGLILVAACIVACAGLLDDVRHLGPMPRLIVEVGAASVAVYAGARIQVFGDGIDAVLSVIALVVLTNSFNLLDNMDSAASAIAADDRDCARGDRAARRSDARRWARRGGCVGQSRLSRLQLAPREHLHG